MAAWQPLQTLNNSSNFNIILHHQQKYIYVILETGIMLKYCNEQNEWTKQNISNELPPGFLKFTSIHSACIDSVNDKIYFLLLRKNF